MTTAIICADLHLRYDTPRCRLDEDWIETQRKALMQIFATAVLKNCDIFCIGDLFHTPKQPERIVNLINEVIEQTMFKGIFYVLAGNHDTKYYDINDTSIGVLLNCRGVNILEDTDEYKSMHTLVFPDKVPPQYGTGKTAKEIADENPDHKWIFLGDYHRFFVKEINNRYILNPGCMLRQTADMKDYQPKIAYIDTGSDLIEWIDVVDDESMITDAYLVEQKERDNRIDAFAEQIKESRENVSMDFWENVDKKSKKASDGVIEVLDKIKEEI